MRTANIARLRRRWWGLTLVWAALVAASLALIVVGLRIALFFFFFPLPEMVEDLRVGTNYILAGSALSLAAAVVSAGLWAPAVGVGFRDGAGGPGRHGSCELFTANGCRCGVPLRDGQRVLGPAVRNGLIVPVGPLWGSCLRIVKGDPFPALAAAGTTETDPLF